MYYASQISAEGFAEEEDRIAQAIEAARESAAENRDQATERAQLLDRFEEVAAMLRDLDPDLAWDEATESERRLLVEELVERVAIFPDHLEVTIAGAPRLNVALAEVGLGGRQSQIVGVGGPTCNFAPRPLVMESGWSELRRAA
ncbi:MAG: hypothetical protein ACYDGN_12935 [Acidimicrobiales bacterium]